MALDIIITIELNREGLGLPEPIKVPRGSRISFRYTGYEDFRKIYGRVFMRIVLYFDRLFPIGIGRNTTFDLISGVPDKRNFLHSKDPHLIAQGMVSEPGEYKYGVRIEGAGETLIDEDPFIIVE